MLESFLLVGQQVLQLFLLVAVGFVLGRIGKLNETSTRGISNLVMYVVAPAMLVVAFQRPLESESLHNFLIGIPVSIALYLINILAAHLLVRDRNGQRQSILRFATVLSNCGYMAFPLQTALLGTIGVFYGSPFVLIFNIVGWTYGVRLIGGRQQKLSARTVLLNPGVIGVTLAVSLYLLQISLPEILLTPVTWLSQLNTPLPMIVVGFQLSHTHLRATLRGASSWVCMALRLVVLPAAALALCLVLRLDHALTVALVAGAAAPAAALLSMLTAKFEGDTPLAASVVSVQTLVSALTMPILVGLAMTLA